MTVGPPLRLLTCGSVDDGKSTLLGRLLLDADALPEDQLAAVTDSNGIDPSLLFDGLSAERSQGITIDVAHRQFDLNGRRIHLADTPGHEQYTRNTATAASTSDAAIVLVDATRGVTTQTRRHLRLIALLGVEHIAIAVNKMDLVDYDEQTYLRIAHDACNLGADRITATAIPVVATNGDNVVNRSDSIDWWSGPTVSEWIDSVDIADERVHRPTRLWVQSVIRHEGKRYLTGRISSGSIRAGDELTIATSSRTAVVDSVSTAGRDPRTGELTAGHSVSITLADQIDCARGDLLHDPDSPPVLSDQFRVTVVWLGEQPMIPGRRHLIRVGTGSATGTFNRPRHTIDVNSGEHLAADVLNMNDIGVCNLSLDRQVAVDPYDTDPGTGGLVIVNRETAETVGLCLVQHPLRRAANLTPHRSRVDRPAREALFGHRGAVVWMTGLSGAGKSTIADALDVALHERHIRTYLLDGDNLRHGLNRDLGFTEIDRVENIRRASEVAALIADTGAICICALISPFSADRELARSTMEPGRFFEIHVDAPLEIAEQRDPKGLYKRARSGDIANFTGIDSPYEPPTNPDLRIDTTTTDVENAVALIVHLLERNQVI